METDIAPLYSSKCAPLKFEFVCFPSNELPRYWSKTKVSKTESIETLATQFRSAQSSW